MTNYVKQPTFLIYDYETFGRHPALDRPAKFASIRVNSNFEPIEKPAMFFCCPADDYLPEPEAVLITGITPQSALNNGVIEAEFARRIHRIFSVPETCILGYNNVRFDDEVSRNIFYRNFYDPYGWSWENGNSRWDLLSVVRACYALRPDGIQWPLNEDGLPSFQLEHLTSANGINNSNFNDAKTDIYATLAIAKLLRQAQPKLFDYLYRYRSKRQLKKLINMKAMKPLVYVSSLFSAALVNTAWIIPLAWHPNNPNLLIVCDLSGDIRVLLNLDNNLLRNRLYTHCDQLDIGSTQVPLKLVYINKCPILAPANTLRSEDAVRLGINRQHCLDNLLLLRSQSDLHKKVLNLYANSEPSITSDNVDAQLYDDLFNDVDRATMDMVRSTSPKNLSALDVSFIDRRLKLLLFRYRARNFANTLNYYEQQRWLEYRRALFTKTRLEDYVQRLELLYHVHEGNEYKIRLIFMLLEYLKQL